MQLLGIDHVTAITASRGECLDFYAGFLNLDPGGNCSQGDLCFGDGSEGPGVLRFVNSPGTPAGTAGPGMVHSLRWWVPGRRALEQWAARFELAGVPAEGGSDSPGDRAALHFPAPGALPHELTPRPVSAPPRRSDGAAVPGMPPALRLGGARAFVAGSVQSFD